jgi:hypothetical protein
MDGRVELVKSAWARIRTCLEDRRHQLHEEIRSYPRPIPACDQQFNYLLEERAQTAEELDRMDEACAECLARGGALERIEEFIRSCRYLDEKARQAVGSLMKEGGAP